MWNTLQEDREEEWDSVGEAVALEDAVISDLIARWKFFAPSPDLAREVLRLNDELGGAYFDGEYDKLAADAGTFPVPEEPIKDENFLRSLLRGVSDILLHGSEDAGQRREQSEEEVTSFFQAFISEKVFNHLAMLSRSRRARKGQPFSIREELTKEIAEKIGLGLYLHQSTSAELHAEAEGVLFRLAGEFQRWLVEEKRGVFTTMWGRIRVADTDALGEDEDSPLLILTPDVEVGEASAATK